MTKNRPLRWISLLACTALLAACASYDGRGLVPGKSTAGDVEQLMGLPTEKIGAANGETVWFYPRHPFGRHTYAVRVAPDGVVRAIEQRLTVQNMQKLVAGETTAKDVRTLFGPPYLVTRFARQERDVWEYPMYDQVQVEYNLFVQFSYDGVLREALFLREMRHDQGAAGDFP